MKKNTSRLMVASLVSTALALVSLSVLSNNASAAACGKIPIYSQNIVNPGIMVQLDVSGSMSTNVPGEVPARNRIDVAEDVLSEVFTDRTISWGFASWTTGTDTTPEPDHVFDAANNYTVFHVGVHVHDDAHQTALQDKVNDGRFLGMTPLAPTLIAGRDYFKRLRNDRFYNEPYPTLDCQPRIVVIVTDGQGNTGTTTATIDAAMDALIAEGVSVVTVGFGLPQNQAGQLYQIAARMKTAGQIDPNDYLYHLHKEVGGVPVPFMAQNRAEFIAAMRDIVANVKAQNFRGSSPAPTTSESNGVVLLSASFDASDWSGDLRGTKFNAYTGELETLPLWKAKDVMPVQGDINGFIYDATSATKVSPYSKTSIAGDNWLCKPLGDIINSTPVIIGTKPPYWYKFDSYSGYKYNPTVRARESLAYVGANDGALHAFKLSNGVEKWRFYPDSVKANLAKATTDSKEDMCSADFCHRYIFDGSPKAADIFVPALAPALGSWKTILTTGLGEGGGAYFALDVTYGNDFDEAVNPSQFLWEFTTTDDNQLGLATSVPSINRVVNGLGAGWATFFASGKEVIDDAADDKEAYLYAVNSWDKGKVWSVDVPNPPAPLPTPTPIYKVKLSTLAASYPEDDYAASPLVVESRVTDYIADRIYLGNRYGNMYRVKNIGFGESPVSEMLYNAEPVFASANRKTPVTAKAEYANVSQTTGDLWVYFGTGSYTEEADKITVEQQYFHGLFDEGANKATPYTPSDLVQIQTDIIEGYVLDKNGNIVDLNGDTILGGPGDLRKYRTLSCPPIVGRCNPNNLSWRLKLVTPASSASERSISRPLVVGGIVFFTTFIPDDDLCMGNGETWLFAVDWKSGEFLTDPVFDLNKDKTFSTEDTTVKQTNGTTSKISGVYIGKGKPSDELALHNDILYVGTTEQAPLPIKVNIPAMQARLESWQQLSD